MTSRIIALDTSSHACTVALGVGDETWVRHAEIPRKHGEWLIPMIDEVLASASISLRSLDAIAYGCGPGSFTGLRIAAGVVQGLAFGAELPVIPVSSLAALAHRGWREQGWTQIHAAFDARMGEIYWGSYAWDQAQQQLSLVGREQLAKPDELSLLSAHQQEGWVGVGSGWCYRELLETQVGTLIACDEALLPHGLDVLSLARTYWGLGKVQDASAVNPVYLRDNVAAKPKRTKQ